MSPISGGGFDRSWLKPLRTDGTVDSDDPSRDNMVGTHQGRFEGFNIYNAQPDCEYIWERNNFNDRIRIRRNGGHVIQAGDPEFSAFEGILGLDDGLSGTPLDSGNTANDLMLVRYSAESVRLKREEETKRANAHMRGGAEDYAHGMSDLEHQYSNADGRPTRFRLAEHGIKIENQDRQLVEDWVPEDGILPRG